MSNIQRAASTRNGKLCLAYLGALASVSFVRIIDEDRTVRREEWLHKLPARTYRLEWL